MSSALEQMKQMPVFINGKKFMPHDSLTALEAVRVYHQFVRCTLNLCGKRCEGDDDCIRQLGLERHFVAGNT